MVAGNGQRHDSRRRRLLAIGAERVGHVAGFFSGVESAARLARLPRHVSLHSVAGPRVALPKLFSIKPQLRSTIFCLADLAFVQSHLSAVQSNVAGWWWWSRCRRVQSHIALIFSHLAELQPHISKL